MYDRYNTIQKAICKVENIYPKDDLILNYQDFLKHRDYLLYYKYNPKVFIALIDLIHDIWNTKKRISRPSLIQVAKRYYLSCEKEKKELPELTIQKIFELFKRVVYYKDVKVVEASRIDLNRAVNNLLSGIKLNEESQKWLCEHAEYSHHILNRVLRYPYKSTLITAWARENYYKDSLRTRRSELAGWIIDEDPTFEVSKNDLIEDFEFFLESDIALFEGKEYLNTKHSLLKEADPFIKADDSIPSERVIPIEQLYQKYHGLYSTTIDRLKDESDNLNYIRDEFYAILDINIQKSNLWAIGFSRHNRAIKSQLLRKNYTQITEWTFLMICKKSKLVGLLKWLLAQKVEIIKVNEGEFDCF